MNLDDLTLEEAYALQNDNNPNSLINRKAVPLESLSLEEAKELQKIDAERPQTDDEWAAYLKNQAKLGVTDSAAFGAATVKTFLLHPIEMIKENIGYGLDGSKSFSEIRENLSVPIPFTEGATYAQRFGEAFQKNQDYLTNITGADPSMTTDDLTVKYAGDALRLATDPVGFMGTAPLKLAEASSPVIKTFFTSKLPRFATLNVVGASATAGADVGDEFEQFVTGKEETSGTGRLVGSLGFGVGSVLIQSTATKTFATPAKQIFDKYKFVKANPDVAEQMYATGAAKRLLEIIADEQGLTDINKVVKDFNVLGQYIDTTDLPLLLSMSDNAVVQSQVRRLVATDADFRNDVTKELASLAVKIDNSADKIFGTKYSTINSPDLKANLQKKSQVLTTQRQNIDSKIEDLGLKFIPESNTQSLGEKVQKLVAAREEIARTEVSPHYENLINSATANGVKMGANDVNDIYNYVKNNRLDDMFGIGSSLEKKISTLKPKKVLDKEKTKVEGKAVYKMLMPELNARQVDSLKRNLNTFGRKKLTDTEARNLDDLKGVVRSGMANMPGGFSDSLRAIDTLYYEKIGIPYNSQGILEIGSKKYADQIAPVLLKNKTALDDFLSISGDEGRNIATNAYAMRIYDKVVVDGELSMKKARALLKKDREVLESLPEAKQLFEEALLDNGKLILKRHELDEAIKIADNEVANHWLLNNAQAPSYDAVARSLASGNMPLFNKILSDLKMVDKKTSNAVMNNIRRQYVDHTFHAKDGAVNFMTDPSQKAVIEKLFADNPTYINDVKALSKLSDSLKLAQIPKSMPLKEEKFDILGKALPGIDTNYAYSQARDRISSNAMKAFRLFTRFNQEGAKTKIDNQIKEILLDPKGLKKLATQSAEFDFRIDNPFKLKKLLNTLGEIVPLYMYESGLTGTVRQQEQ